MEINCPAKINLLLEVIGRRPDGYHDIRTVFQTLEFADRMKLRARSGPGLRLTVKGEAAGLVPTGEDNLVHRAYSAFQQAFGPVPGLRVTLDKRIPPGAGLGGGSSDAASMLLALRQICNRPGSRTDLEPVAAELGSDVTFFLHGGTALGTGRGERLTVLPEASKHMVLLILPEMVLSSTRVYQAVRPILTSGANRISIHRYLDEKGEVCLHRDYQRNDLESVVFRMVPELRRLKDLLYEAGAGFASLSGSGAGLYGLFTSKAQAAEAAGCFEARACRAVLTRFLGREGHGAVQGGPV